MTVRLNDKLKDKAVTYADQIGISLNSLMSIALVEYLNNRDENVTAQAAGRLRLPANIDIPPRRKTAIANPPKTMQLQGKRKRR